MSTIELYQQLHSSLVQTNLKMASIEKHVEVIAHNTSHRALPSHAAAGGAEPLPSMVTPEPARKRRFVQMPLVTVTQTSNGAVVVSPAANLAAPPPSIGIKIELSTLLFLWYGHAMYVVDSGLSQPQRTVRLLFAKAICYCKQFLPTGTVLRTRPPGAAEAAAWGNEMKQLGRVAQAAVLNHIATHCPSKGKKREAYVEGCMKRLQKLNLDTFPSSVVVDSAVEAAKASGVPCWHYASLADFKK